nr:F3H9.20 protein [Ipomoea batatas]
MNSITAAMALLSPSISSIAFDNRPSPCPAPTSRRGGGRKLLVLSSFTTNTALFNPLSSASVAPTTAGAATLSIVKRKVACQAVGESSPPPSDSTVVYQGIYGPWTVEDSDVREVILYRSGLVTAAVSFVLASSAVLLPDDSVLRDLIKSNVDILYMLGACGLGLSLYLIHIYVTEIKRTLQAFWAIGVFGSLATYAALAQPAGSSLVQYVVENPTAVWFVGPLFAALTGLVFKEGLCYGKLEAGILTFVIPSVLLGHLTGLMDDGVKVTLLSVWMALFLVFAGRKFTQPIKDDIGDKSVFIFNALPEEEKAALIDKLDLQKYQENSK